MSAEDLGQMANGAQTQLDSILHLLHRSSQDVRSYGASLEENRAALEDPETTVRTVDELITLTRTMMMTPAKSTSIVQGVGQSLPVQAWSRCDSCRSRARCTLARATA